MDRFLVISPHTEKECAQALKQTLYAGFITHFDWGCAQGEHSGYAIIEAHDAKEASLVLPPIQRMTAKVIRLQKYSPEEIQDMH